MKEITGKEFPAFHLIFLPIIFALRNVKEAAASTLPE